MELANTHKNWAVLILMLVSCNGYLVLVFMTKKITKGLIVIIIIFHQSKNAFTIYQSPSQSFQKSHR